MKMNFTKATMIVSMLTSSMATMASNNFLFSWMMMEMNMISFMPIMTKSNKMKDQTMKYFIIQSAASSILLMSTLMNSIVETPINNSMLLTSSLLMKLGLIPFHLWMPMIMKSMNWENCFLMSTLQKIIPIFLTMQMSSTKMMNLPMILSMMIAPLSALNQLSTKKIMAFSSISNTPWMILSMTNSKMQFSMFMMVYSTLTLMAMKKMKKMNMMFINQTTTNTKNKKMMVLLWLSMSGMPPMTGFLPKWIILQSTMHSSMMTMSMTMILSSIMMTFVYMKMISTMMMEYSQKKKKKKKEKKEKDFSIIFNLMGLPTLIMLKS